MSAAASLVIPLSFASPASEAKALQLFQATAGIAQFVVSVPEGTATLSYEFPGNIDGLVRRLSGVGVKAGPTVKVSVPVKNLSGRVIDPTRFLADLKDSPAVIDAAFDGDTVTGTIVCATNAFRYIYEEIIIHGLMPLDVPTVAHPQEFVL